jgi:Sap, sulfolipid-1-addressing protein
METLILSVIGLGLAIALCSPVSVVTVIVLLAMPAGRRRAFAFVGGWVAAIALIAAATFALHGEDFHSRSTTPSRTASALEVLVGVLVFVAAWRAFRRRSQRAVSTAAPKWLERLDRTNWLLAVVVGAFMLTYSLTLAAAIEILKADVSIADTAVAFGAFALASMSTIVAPIVVVFVAPERSEERLAAWRGWLLGNSRTIGLVALMVIGAALVARGAYDLFA